MIVSILNDLNARFAPPSGCSNSILLVNNILIYPYIIFSRYSINPKICFSDFSNASLSFSYRFLKCVSFF